ncbi:MAG: aminopeptidase [Planctomycetes bacterium]|nr:aminopeptidase [Planctomycetota bacterium]
MDARIRKLAQVLVRYSTAVRPKDVVVIRGSTVAAPLATEVYREVLEAGGLPWVRLVPDTLSEIFFRHAKKEHLETLNPIEPSVLREANVTIGIWAGTNTKSLSRTDPAKQASISKTMRPLMEEQMRRSGLPAKDPRHLRWVGTLLPNDAAAQDAEMGILDYEEFVYRAGKLDQKDPVAAWKKLGASQQRLADRLEKGREMHITTPEGTDIRYGIRGRTWINCDGKNNFPDGEVFTGPIEDATEGVVKYSFPAVHGGREVRDITLRFKAGRVVDCSASHNEEFLVKMLDQDKGARVLGELALGTNYSIKEYSKNTLFDEKIGGTYHAALGAAYPESGGTNKSGLHWDMVCDLRKGGVVRVDGKVISKNGRFAEATWPK